MQIDEQVGNLTPKILVVVDEVDFCRLVTEALVGFTVVEAGDGREALAIVAEKKLDLVITKILTPNIDGFALLENLRAKHPQLPVLAVSGNSDAEEVWIQDFDGYIDKPVRPAQLRDLVKKKVAQRKNEDNSRGGWIVFDDIWRQFRKQRLGLIGGGILCMLLLVALLAPVLAPYDPLAQDLYQRLQPPSIDHWFGTDDFGRDILSRIVYGSRISLRIGLIAISLALTGGTLLGLVAGYRGGMVDMLIMRLMDLMLAFPSILLAIAIVAVIGPGIENAILAVSIVLVPQFARLVRSSVLTVREATYVEAARALGATESRLLFYGILPNCTAPLIVQTTLGMGTAILDAAGLSFLGMGAQPPVPEWGAMLSGGRELLLRAPWVMTFPGLAIFTVVLGLNLFGDGLRDALDPKTT